MLNKETKGAAAVEYGLLLTLIGAVSIGSAWSLGSAARTALASSNEVIASKLAGTPKVPAVASSPVAPSGPPPILPEWSETWPQDGTYPAGTFTKDFVVYYFDSGGGNFTAAIAGRGDGVPVGGVDYSQTLFSRFGGDMTAWQNAYLAGSVESSFLSVTQSGFQTTGAGLCGMADVYNFNPQANPAIAGVSMPYSSFETLTTATAPTSSLPVVSIGASMNPGAAVKMGSLDSLAAYPSGVSLLKAFTCSRDALPSDNPGTGQLP